MSEKLTAEEYLNTQKKLGWDDIDIETAETYGDIRAKEAVDKFARQLIEYNTKHGRSSFEITMIAKQHGVEL